MYCCRITVKKRLYFPEFVEEYGSQEATTEIEGDQHIGPCYAFQEGDTFVLRGIDDYTFMNIPKGFCTYAWQAIGNFVVQGLREGRFYKSWMKDDNKMLVSCLDGMRPVIFLVEVYEEEDQPDEKE